MIEMRNVSLGYMVGGKRQGVLFDVDLEVPKGKLVVILGPSGAGKTTLLNLVAGLERPEYGKIIIGGEEISKYKQNQLADFRARKVGVVFQAYNLLPALTAQENVEMVGEVGGGGFWKKKRRIDGVAALKMVGLAKMARKFPAEMSGGEQQRVAIARAVSGEAELLLCDEPTGALDSKNGVRVLKILKKQVEQGKTVVIVTHNQLMMEVADMVIWIKNGRIQRVKENRKPKQIEEVEW